MITHKFRIYPSKKTELKLVETLDVCRQAYNYFLGELNQQKVIDKSQLQATIPDLGICDERFKSIYQKCLQMELYKLFSNLSGLSSSKKKGRRVGSLRFKGKNVFKTFTYNQFGFKLVWKDRRNSILKLSKIGNIPIRCHRKVTGKIKQITIKHFQSGKWFAFVVEDGNIKTKIRKAGKIVGIDLGLTDVVWDSDNNHLRNPRHLRQKSKRLKHCQRLMSRKKKGSNNRDRFRIRLARAYETLTNSRDDYLHKVSNYYIQNYDTIAMEDFKITKMVKGKFGKHILDAGWGKLRQYLTYKAENTGKSVMLVDYKGTTQRCSQCGTIVPKDLSQREHSCSFCGFESSRDYNSALEIKRLCLLNLGQGLSESKHLEMEALPLTRQLSSMKNEAPSSTAGVT